MAAMAFPDPDHRMTPQQPDASRPEPHQSWIRLIVLALVGIALSAAALLGATQWASERALQEATVQAHNAGQLNAALLRNNLDKFRALPVVLTRDVDVQSALQTASNTQIISLDEKLENLSRDVGAAAIYVLDRSGTAIAASNWREPASFVGIDYQFRPYFQGAISEGQAEHFALGTVSRESGLYLSRRIDNAAGEVLGVVVLKVDFRDLEADWRQSNAPMILVTDEHNVVILASDAKWRFDVLAPLSPELADKIRGSLQFGTAPFNTLPLAPELSEQTPGQLVRTLEPLRQLPKGSALLHISQPIVESAAWTLHLLWPVQSAISRATASAQLAVLLVLALITAIIVALLYRRHLTLARSNEQAALRQELAAQIAIRTRQLREVNEQLLGEMDERQRAEARLHTMQEELVQASKLALLGQVTAGVAHEINQPVAAIRSYADNASEYLRRNNALAAQNNLAIIAELTTKIGDITAELRAFSRKADTSVTPTSLKEVLDGALLLVGPRMRRQNVTLQRPPASKDWLVLANRVRLEQVLVNLLQNALEALDGQQEASILVSIAEHEQRIHIAVRDNGPGLSDQTLARLFTPFHTTKAEGLGLGLVISRDIVREFGGELSAFNIVGAGLRGAEFVIILNKANSPESHRMD